LVGELPTNKKYMKPTSKNYPQKEIESLKSKLGKSTWTALHSFASAYPMKPTPEQQTSAKNLIESVSVLYPCKTCADDFKQYIQANPPKIEDK
jgi:mitochondrial FAD-linked sulfhydryl oxidase